MQTEEERTSDGCITDKIGRFMEATQILGTMFWNDEELFGIFIEKHLYRDYAEMLANDIIRRRSWAKDIKVAIDKDRMEEADPEYFPFLFSGFAELSQINDILFHYAQATAGEKPVFAKGKIIFSSLDDEDSQRVEFDCETVLTDKEIFEFGDALEYCLHDALKEWQDYLTAVYLGKSEYMREAFYAYRRMNGGVIRTEDDKPVKFKWVVYWNEFFNMHDHSRTEEFGTEDEALAFFQEKDKELLEKYSGKGLYDLDEVLSKKGADYRAMSYNNGEVTTYVEILKKYE